MANELLDFVMSLVRDPDAAARYAENPDQAIFDAHLTNVTSADVSNLIPVVTESLGTVVPTTGAEGIADFADNVWASGAATAAFDAFDDQVPVQAVDDVHTVITDYPGVDDSPGADAGVPGVVGSDDAALHFDQPIIDDLPMVELPSHGDLHDAVIEVADMDSDPSGFDLF
ncbi:Rv0340 family IniB-related protein [Mycobacterium sp. 2YAF39]|uniref:Rv0340 family IniB-related protein n=1 Tax=Mycobacterium sp. 2YAF39 TaxID=3233033 RepID=UPI003F96E52D